MYPWVKIWALGLARYDWCPTFVLNGQASAAHQPGCVLAANVNALAGQHAPHLPHAVDTVIFGNERHDYAPTRAASRRLRALKPRALD